MARWAFDTLGINATKDKKTIKKAYSALVKQYHPEEYPEEWSRLHEAYQSAMEYAERAGGGAEDVHLGGYFSEEKTETESQEEMPGTGCAEDRFDEEEEAYQEDDYEEMFEAAHIKWKKEQSEKSMALAKRLNELVQAPMAVAVSEWKQFFATEFLLGVDEEELMLLFEAVHGSDIPANAAQVIAVTMAGRKEFYQNSMEFNKASLANKIANCIYQKYPKLEASVNRRKKGIKGILKEMAFGAVLGIFLLIAFAGIKFYEGNQKSEAVDAAVRQLNEKYGGNLYDADNIEAEMNELYGDSADTLISYKIIEKESSDVVGYMLGKKGDEGNLLCYDRLQDTEIKNALEADINARTGRQEGKLYWNSAGGAGECIEDGYFHEKYESNISEFLRLEGKARETVAGFDTDGVFSAKNGKADYYIPDKDIETLKQRLELKEGAEDKELTSALGQCAEDYDMQVCGVMLPGKLFEERMRQAGWEEEGIFAKSSLYQTGMFPPMSLALMTGWYVCVPSYGQEYLKLENGMYSGRLIDMAEGIWGIENRIRVEMRMPGGVEMPEGLDFDIPGMSAETDFAGTLEMVNAPESLGLSEAKGQKSVSFCLAGGRGLGEDRCLIIDKAAYGIPDSGYRVMLTKFRDGNEETQEQPPVSYSELNRDVGNGDSLDGEGYLFTKYPEAWEGEKNPVLTVVF